MEGTTMRCHNFDRDQFCFLRTKRVHTSTITASIPFLVTNHLLRLLVVGIVIVIGIGIKFTTFASASSLIAIVVMVVVIGIGIGTDHSKTTQNGIYNTIYTTVLVVVIVIIPVELVIYNCT